MSDPTAIEIIALWLRAHGYDGLRDGDCGCGLDELLVCRLDHALTTCRAGVKVPCDCGDHGCEYHIVPREGTDDDQ